MCLVINKDYDLSRLITEWGFEEIKLDNSVTYYYLGVSSKEYDIKVFDDRSICVCQYNGVSVINGEILTKLYELIKKNVIKVKKV